MSGKTPGFGDLANPFGEVDDVETRYVPPSVAPWEAPQQPAATTIDAPADEDDEPFTAAHLAAASQSAVPAVSPTGTAAAPAPPLAFTASVPRAEVSGKIGGGGGGAGGSNSGARVPSVPRLGSAAADTTTLLGGSAPSAPAPAPGSEDPSSYPFYSIKRYRTYFNVDTDEVLARIFRAVALFFKGDFFDRLDGNPDLYGPFWIASTLVFVSAAAGNTASYIAFRKAAAAAGTDPDAPGAASAWYYDVDKVGGSMGLFYGYVGLVGLALWGVLRWGFKAGVRLAEVWCLYGYALAAYIPMAALCVLPMEVVRWSLVGAATAISGVFLALNFRAAVVEAAGAKAVPVLLAMLGAHAVLGLSLKLYFFRYSA